MYNSQKVKHLIFFWPQLISLNLAENCLQIPIEYDNVLFIITIYKFLKISVEQSIEALITISATAEHPSVEELKKAQSNQYYYQMEKEFKGDDFSNKNFHIENKSNTKEFLEFEEQVKKKLSSLSFSSDNTNKVKKSNYFKPKREMESLCGLKVQYRTKGSENNNSDDDADVVIEEESSDYTFETPPSESINVCQFLSSSTQCPPKTTFPKVQNFKLFCIISIQQIKIHYYFFR